MTAARVVIIDYGAGNLFSLQRVLSVLGAEPVIARSPDEARGAERIILPGVGAFGDAMRRLQERGFRAVLAAGAQSGTPLLGICLGMQLLFDSSEEFGQHAGLGLLPGKVVRLPAPQYDGPRYKVPHVGWSPVLPAGDAALHAWPGSLLRACRPGDFFYFSHSYYAVPAVPGQCLAVTPYAGVDCCAVAGSGAVTGCQFHPELSGPAGLALLRSFISRGEHAL